MKGIKPNFQHKQKNREKTRQRKIITRTKKYLRGSAICLLLLSENNTKYNFRLSLLSGIIQSTTFGYNILSLYKTRQQHHTK